jgi:hypothetical protein
MLNEVNNIYMFITYYRKMYVRSICMGVVRVLA